MITRSPLHTGSIQALALVALSLLFAAPGVHAAIVVEPVVLDITAPAGAGAVTLRNNDPAKITVQTRVFRWTQSNGQETLTPAVDVAASPPIVTLVPGSDYTVRVVRTADTPVTEEESYRVVVDELPNLRRDQPNTVNILVRQSIPVFFRTPRVIPPDVIWSYRIEKDVMRVFATNRGGDRLRVASLRLRDRYGKEISFGNGLVGYVLGRSSMTFETRVPAPGFASADTVALETETSAGHIQAVASRRDQP